MTEDKHLQDLLAFALELASLSERATMAYFRQAPPAHNKQSEVFDPVTRADREAEDVMRAHIEKHFPDHGIHGEEYGRKAGLSSFTWIIDPIDGTKGYICGLPTWMTLIGLYENGRPVAGVAHQPVAQDTFYGTFEKSFLRHRGEDRALQVKVPPSLDQSFAGTTGPGHYNTPAQRGFLQGLQEQTLNLRLDADAYFYSLVAAGQMDIAVDVALQAYDIAALIPIIEGAGGRVTTFEGGNACHGGDVIATCGGQLHDEVLELWRQAKTQPASPISP